MLVVDLEPTLHASSPRAQSMACNRVSWWISNCLWYLSGRYCYFIVEFYFFNFFYFSFFINFLLLLLFCVSFGWNHHYFGLWSSNQHTQARWWLVGLVPGIAQVFLWQHELSVLEKLTERLWVDGLCVDALKWASSTWCSAISWRLDSALQVC